MPDSFTDEANIPPQAPLADATKSDCEAALRLQYDAAIRMYLHEDQVNWNKIRALLFSNAAIAAVYQTISTSTPTNSTMVSPYIMQRLLPLLGLLLTAAFVWTLFNGRAYLRARKEACRGIENTLFKQTGHKAMINLSLAVESVMVVCLFGIVIAALWAVVLIRIL
jgi:hypothetical protein